MNNWIKVSLWVFTVAAVLFGSSLMIFGSYQWQPSAQAIEINRNTVSMVEFEAKAGFSYQLDFAIEPVLSGQELSCLLGIVDKFSSACPSDLNSVRFSWQLEREGKVVASGHTNDKPEPYWGELTGLELYRFEPVSSSNYRFSLNLLEGNALLAKSNPRVNVQELNPGFEGAFVIANLARYLPYPMFMLSALVLVLGLLKARGLRNH